MTRPQHTTTCSSPHLTNLSKLSICQLVPQSGDWVLERKEPRQSEDTCNTRNHTTQDTHQQLPFCISAAQRRWNPLGRFQQGLTRPWNRHHYVSQINTQRSVILGLTYFNQLQKSQVSPGFKHMTNWAEESGLEMGFIPHLWALAALYLDSAFLEFLSGVHSAHPKYSDLRRSFQASGADKPRPRISYKNHPSEPDKMRPQKCGCSFSQSLEHKQINR